LLALFLSARHAHRHTHTFAHATMLSAIPGTQFSAQCKLFSWACWRLQANHKSRQSGAISRGDYG